MARDELRKGRVLVIDDDAEMRAVLEQTLASAGYEVALAADGRRGVAQYRALPADLVIVDIFMPNQDGLETITQLRRDFPGVAIIAISGRPGGETMMLAARRMGAVRTVTKPFEPEELLAVVAQELQRKP
jgi:DNA-binding response OmpR family regulator